MTFSALVDLPMYYLLPMLVTLVQLVKILDLYLATIGTIATNFKNYERIVLQSIQHIDIFAPKCNLTISGEDVYKPNDLFSNPVTLFVM